MAGPFVSPVAQSIPFEPNRDPSYLGGPSGLTAQNVQDAIEEAKADAFANDRFIFLAQYGGNASAGRSLEIFSGISSDEASLTFVSPVNLLSITARTTSSGATCVVSLFNRNVSTVTPVYSITLTAQKINSASGTPLVTIPANSIIEVRITSGSILKPHVQFTLSSAT